MSHNETLWILRRTISNTVAASILLFIIGPFASQSALQRMADDTAGSVLNQLLYNPESQQQIAVVLLDDEALENLQEKWPLPRQYWTTAAQILACSGAKAIFFDLLFEEDKLEAQATNNPLLPLTLKDLDQRLWSPSSTELKENCTKRLHSPAPTKPVPVYFAFTRTPGDWLPSIANDHKLLIEWEPIGSSYPLAQLRGNTLYKTASYALSEHGVPPNREEKKTEPQSSENTESRTPPEGVEKRNLPLSYEHAETRVIPLWTQKVDKSQLLWNDLAICQESKVRNKNQNLFAVGARWAADSLHITRPYLNLSPAQCTPFLTINLSQIINHDGERLRNLRESKKVTDPLEGPGEKEVPPSVRNRIVLVGQSFRGNYDYVPAPMHSPQQLPGVYLHATVLENLLTMEMKFNQLNPHPWILPHPGLLVLGLVVVFSFLEAVVTAPPGPWAPMNNWKYWLPVGLCMLLLSGLYFRCILNWPLGMIPKTASLFTLDLLLVKIFHHDIIYQWVDRLFGIDPHHEK